MEDNDPQKSYRSTLVSLFRKSEEEYGKAVLTLSGGALGITFAFVKDFAFNGTVECPVLMLLSWISWGFSVIFILFSYLTSRYSLEKAIKQCDNDRIYSELPGGKYTTITLLLNISSGFLFVIGVFLISTFLFINLR